MHADEARNLARDGDVAFGQFCLSAGANVAQLSKRPDIYEILTKSLVPNIWELDDVKKGLLCQALLHASVARNRKLIVDWVPTRDLEDVTYKEGVNGVLVPGGFGDRGVQGKILAAKYA
ncbi:hypothetical protein Fmac_029368 [Flemingia macrophylla]|uniref:MCM C-terminal AAA(+) ATPase domain-containing protein n=1 Tax=Flemingia macrophylla TaxID=520843 RepID=A0ABD1LA50_9FABA